MKKEDTDLRDRTKKFARRILRMYSDLPKTTEAQVLGKQVLRSGTSVGANYREAHRGRSKAEFIAKCGDSLREIEETGYWLELLVEAEAIPVEMLANLRSECDQLTAIFVIILKRAKETRLDSLRISQLPASNVDAPEDFQLSSFHADSMSTIPP